MDNSIKAVSIEEEGGLSLSEIPMPSVESGQLLVAIKAADVNRADLMQRRGLSTPPPNAPDKLV